MDIYDRQKTLKLKTNISLTIIGCGGVGFWVAKFAAMTGIEKFYLFDDDVIEIHNLNRLDLGTNFLGKNKADAVKRVIEYLRPDATSYSYPYKFSENFPVDSDWLVDCTDNFKSQETNEIIAKGKGIKYVKAGYDGMSISINDTVAQWGETEDGYRVVPSFVVPAVIVAALTVAKIVKYEGYEVGTTIPNIFNYKN